MGRALSLWHDTAPPRVRSAPLPGDVECDVAVVGGGFTGLWTAYYLLRADPSLRVVVLEAEEVGFGASGRNGGWCSALFPNATTPAQEAAMVATIDEVERVLAAERIDAHFHRGGTVVVARSRAQLTRAAASGDQLLGEAEARKRLNASGTIGGTFTPRCARVHPLRLARGLAEVVERLGGVIHEGTRVESIEHGVARTALGTVRARVVVRATEGYTAGLSGLRRRLIPVYSLIVATEPLPASLWDEIGLADRETFSDHRHLVVYGQRTADDRLLFGGRGAPYHWASSTKPSNDTSARVFRTLQETVVEMFPVLAKTEFTHAWGGALGIARDWHASVGLEGTPARGTAWAGGYVGDGVSTTNLAGRTLRDLILGHETELTRLPWVGHRSPSWEPEPLRWLEVNAGLRAMTLADTEERLTKRPSRIARLMAPFIGGH